MRSYSRIVMLLASGSERLAAAGVSQKFGACCKKKPGASVSGDGRHRPNRLRPTPTAEDGET